MRNQIVGNEMNCKPHTNKTILRKAKKDYYNKKPERAGREYENNMEHSKLSNLS